MTNVSKTFQLQRSLLRWHLEQYRQH